VTWRLVEGGEDAADAGLVEKGGEGRIRVNIYL
jgi:hypothetical protein